ncbi:MAG: transporter substrate-binding domain-containing protein [Psychrobium sp.]|nr:transporter substrate-binding domain-containing protein [Psychrobium sp.]
MRLILLATLLFISLSTLAKNTVPVPAATSIKIAIFDDFVPYSFVGKNGKAQGFLVDYWRLWAEKVNRNIEFVPMSLAQSTKALQQQQVTCLLDY